MKWSSRRYRIENKCDVTAFRDFHTLLSVNICINITIIKKQFYYFSVVFIVRIKIFRFLLSFIRILDLVQYYEER